jgi:hypothetical protein
VGLKRLTKIYQWLEPGLDESAVFEMQRANLFKFAQHPGEWVNSLPQAIYISKPGAATSTNVLNDFAKQSKKFIDSIPSSISKMKSGSPESAAPSLEEEIYGRLPATMELIETMIEDENRFTMYEAEVETIHQLGMSFQEWRQLAPASTAQGNGSDLIYITMA